MPKPLITRPLSRLSLALLVAAGWSSVFAQDGAVDCTQVEAVAFMLGSWRQETQGTVFEERWQRQADGSFKGHAESFKSDGTEHYQEEDMIIRAEAGTLVYAADPDKDGVFVEFMLVSCAEGSAVFENPDHDFPNRLAYRRDEEGRLHARVTDLDDQGFDLTFQPDRS